MAYLQKKLLSSWLLIFCNMMLMINFMVLVSARPIEHYTPPNITRLTARFNHLSYNHGFTEVYGGSNIEQIKNGSYVNLTLKKNSGSGLVSQNKYNYGFFSAAIKLPPGYTSGVVVAFYLSNGNIFPHNHDEIDIELLGHENRKDWVLQTNIYGNGSVKTGREEKFYLWFDPTQDFHQYSIIWNSQHIVFLVDDIPVRQAPNTAAFYPVYPSKPMSVYATIWDGSEWATRGGKYPVNYKYAPFIASFGQMVMEGCKLEDLKDSDRGCAKSSLSGLDPVGGQEFTTLSKQQSTAMDWARKKLMFYSYCKDSSRFKSMPPECKT